MKMSSTGLDLVKSFEGLYLKAYKCPAGVWTIGYGHTGKTFGKNITSGMTITKTQATKLLADDMKVFEKGVKALVKVPLNQNQFDALVSFSFNCGLGNLKSSTLLKKLNAGKYSEAAEQFLVWNKAAGKVLAGLTRRRKEEKKLFSKPIPKKVSTYSQVKFIKELQKLSNLKTTGVANRALLRSLPIINQQVDSNEYIKPLKKILKQKGYSVGKIDFKWDKEFASAVKSYKKAHEFDAITPRINEVFWKKLLKL